MPPALDEIIRRSEKAAHRIITIGICKHELAEAFEEVFNQINSLAREIKELKEK